MRCLLAILSGEFFGTHVTIILDDHREEGLFIEFIGSLIHSTKIKLNEQGVEAAAATVFTFGAGLPIEPPDKDRFILHQDIYLWT